MVVALLACLAGTVGTGLVAYGEQGRGPLAGALTVTSTTPSAESGDGRSKAEETLTGELHVTLANLTLVLVVIHILGVGLANFVHRENLVAAMISGKKCAED